MGSGALAFEVLDKTLRDMLSVADLDAATKTFEGKTIFLGGDFEQIMSVISQDTKQQTLMVKINSSYLWNY